MYRGNHFQNQLFLFINLRKHGNHICSRIVTELQKEYEFPDNLMSL